MIVAAGDLMLAYPRDPDRAQLRVARSARHEAAAAHHRRGVPAAGVGASHLRVRHGVDWVSRGV